MSKDQEINAGDNSTNVQGKQVTVIQNYSGISYSDVKEIAMDVFKSNFYDLGQSVEKIVNERAERVLDQYLEKLNSINPKLIKNTEDPDIRYNIYKTQKNFARRDDKDIGELLVDTLVQRTITEDNELKEIILNEALEAIPKMTSKQIDLLSMIFLIKYLSFIVETPVEEFLKLFASIKYESIPYNHLSTYEHLQFTSCISISIASMNFITAMRTKFPQLRNEDDARKAISTNEYIRKLGDIWDKSQLCHCSLTSVGIAIALTNIKIKTGIDLDLNLWIGE